MSLDELMRNGQWSTEPVAATVDGDALRVEAHEGSDAWRVTSYDFIHDNAHALLAPLGPSEAVEVSFVLDYKEQFDQAGLMIRVDELNWIKAGVEVSDGVAQVGAVVTRGVSDWSVAPVPEWVGREVTVRASRDGDAVTIRARVEDEPWRLVRVAPLDPAADARAGLFCAAPTRSGLVATFTAHRRGEPDGSLH
jgi:regulation of enolase protein 1 (concanavalin A-like superfamily)